MARNINPCDCGSEISIYNVKGRNASMPYDTYGAWEYWMQCPNCGMMGESQSSTALAEVAWNTLPHIKPAEPNSVPGITVGETTTITGVVVKTDVYSKANTVTLRLPKTGEVATTERVEATLTQQPESPMSDNEEIDERYSKGGFKPGDIVSVVGAVKEWSPTFQYWYVDFGDEHPSPDDYKYAALVSSANLTPHSYDDDWQDIETIPDEFKDGIKHCLVNDGGFVCEARYDPDYDGWWRANTDYSDAHDGQVYPTHWRRMPLPPKI